MVRPRQVSVTEKRFRGSRAFFGLLASVVVHSVARAPVRLGSQPHIVGSVVAAVVYACATFAGVMHVVAAAISVPLLIKQLSRSPTSPSRSPRP